MRPGPKEAIILKDFPSITKKSRSKKDSTIKRFLTNCATPLHIRLAKGHSTVREAKGFRPIRDQI